jgi:hypothetical protein
LCNLIVRVDDQQSTLVQTLSHCDCASEQRRTKSAWLPRAMEVPRTNTGTGGGVYIPHPAPNAAGNDDGSKMGALRFLKVSCSSDASPLRSRLHSYLTFDRPCSFPPSSLSSYGSLFLME